MSENDDVLARLKALEEENLKLKQKLEHGQQEEKETETFISSYKGNPVINFKGAFKPFSFGLKKSSIILEKIEEIQIFVDNHRHKMDEI